MSAAQKSGSTFSQSLTTSEQDHRREIQILSQINKDLRSDTQRREEHLENLRASLKLTNQELFDLAVELKTIQDRSSNVEKDEDGGKKEEEVADGNRQRVVALMEARIQRLENQLKDREESFQKERNELTQLINKASRTPQKDDQLASELRTAKESLNEGEVKLEAVKHQLDLTRNELQMNVERSTKREEELQRDRESIEASYENMVKNLREELTKAKQSKNQPTTAAPDSGRTFSLPGGAAVTTVTPSPVGNISALVKNLTEQLQEKDSEIRRLSVAFQAFKDEMLKMPASDQTIIGQITEQKNILEDQVEKLRDTNAKLTSQLRKEKTNGERLEKEAEDSIAETRKKEEKRRKEDKVASEKMAARIAALEDELGQRRSKSTDDAKESRLRNKVAELEKALAKAQSSEPTTTSVKPEVRQWEEKKKWEKIVQTLKVKLKERDDAATVQSTMLTTVKEALARSEQDRGLMDKKLASLSKRLTDLSQQPQYLQQSLAESHKEIDRLKELLEEQTDQKSALENELVKMKESESIHAGQMKDLTEKYSQTVRNTKLFAKKSEETRGQMEEEIRSLQDRVADLEDVIAQSKMEASDVPRRAKESVDMKKAVRTMKNVIDEQQAELEALKRQNASMRTVIQQTVEERDRITKKKPTTAKSTTSVASTGTIRQEDGRSRDKPSRGSRQRRPMVDRHEEVGGGDARNEDYDMADDKDEGISVSVSLPVDKSDGRSEGEYKSEVQKLRMMLARRDRDEESSQGRRGLSVDWKGGPGRDVDVRMSLESRASSDAQKRINELEIQLANILGELPSRNRRPNIT